MSAIKALHRAIYYPNSLILLLSPSLRQSSELFRKVTDFSRGIRNAPEKVEDSKLFVTFSNRSRIVSLPGKEGTVRGYSGACLIIIDEAAQVPDDLYLAIRPTLAVSDGALILMSTPRGKRGFYFHEFEEGGEIWERFKVTADECPRISKDFLNEERQKMPPWWFRQEYYCSFEEAVDSVFTYDLIQKAFTCEGNALCLEIVL